LEFNADHGEAALGQRETLNYKAGSRIFKEFGMGRLKQELFEASEMARCATRKSLARGFRINLQCVNGDAKVSANVQLILIGKETECVSTTRKLGDSLKNERLVRSLRGVVAILEAHRLYRLIYP
jgi:hypothetical protein